MELLTFEPPRDRDGLIRLADSLPTLRKGSRGSEVRALQLLVGAEDDGIFGPLTQKAVKAHQKSAHVGQDGVCGPVTWFTLLVGEGENVRPPDFKQFDSRWAAKIYSASGDIKQTMRSSGCGPTAAADIIAHLRDSAVTPPDMAALALKWGCRTKTSGTAGAFFEKLAKHYNLPFKRTSDTDTVVRTLQRGGLVAVCFGPSKWTDGGHYCVLWRYAGGEFSVNDPGSSSAARTKGTYDEVKRARKAYYCFGKETK